MKDSLKVERAKHDLTQEQLAQMVNVSRQTINSIEEGRYVPSTLSALRLSVIFGITVNDLFKLSNEDSPK